MGQAQVHHCPCQLDKNELINELYLYLQSDNWYKLRQFDFRSKLTTWLTVVAVRFFRKRKPAMIDSPNNYTLYSDAVERIPGKMPYAQMIEKMDVINAIQKLKSARDKFILLSIEIEGYEAKEIANQLGITKANDCLYK